MKQTYYFSHDYYAREDRKLVNLTMKHGMEGIGIFWCLIEMLYEEGGYLPFEYDRFAFELRTDINKVKSIINDFELFKNNTLKFWSVSVMERLSKRREKSDMARESVRKRWDKAKKNTIVLPTNNDRITIKEKKIKEIKETKDKIPFKIFWDNYDKKIDWERCEKIWNKLTNSEQGACMKRIPAYIKSTPDKKFRLNPEKYLIQKGWQNEFVNSNSENESATRGKVERTNDLWN